MSLVGIRSSSADFAAELHRQHRMLIHSEWYRSAFPAGRTEIDTDTELVTERGAAGSRRQLAVL